MILNNILLNIFLFIFILLNMVWVIFDPLSGFFQFTFTIITFNMPLFFGIDAISFFFIYLTSLLIPLCMLFTIISRTTLSVKNNNLILLFTVGLLLLVVFYTLDLLIFYVSFEAILVPFFIYIGIAGYRNRRIHAAYLFFFYTLSGSFFTLVAIFFIILHTGSTNIEIISNCEFSGNYSILIWFSLFITFAIKVPMFPFHIWLPEAHVEAPTEGSVLLAGLLLKLGTFGLVRYLFPLFSDLNNYFSSFVIMLASIGIIYTSFSTLRQIDIKRVVAYSSIAHMNMCIIGLFSYNSIAFIGSIFLMIGHGVVSAGLFFIIGMIYNRYNTKIIHYFGGVIYFMPILSFFFFIFIIANIGMPGTSNFIGELLILTGLIYTNNITAVLGGIVGIFLCTVYSMWLYNKVVFMLPKYRNIVIFDLFFYEIMLLMYLLIFVFLLGIVPDIINKYLSYIYYFNFMELGINNNLLYFL